MPKPIKWASQAHAVRERVSKSTIETWGRQEIEWAFDIKRVAAQELMKAIGGSHTIGSKRFVGRAEILEFLDEVIKADDIRSAIDSRKVEVGPQARRKKIRFPIPQDAESFTMLRLPDNVELSPLQIVIKGESTEELLTNLFLLGQAFLNDPVSMEHALEPLPTRRPVGRESLQEWIRSRHPKKMAEGEL